MTVSLFWNVQKGKRNTNQLHTKSIGSIFSKAVLNILNIEALQLQ